MDISAFICWVRAEGDRLVGFGCLGGGALLVVLAYWGLSDSADPAQGMAYLSSGGIGGLFLVGLGSTLLLSADLRDTWRKLRGLERSAMNGGSSPQDQSANQLVGQSSTGGGYAPVAAGIGMGVSLGILVFGWNHIATDGSADEAFEGLAVAATGLLVCGLVAGSFIVVMRRAVERRARSLFAPWLSSTAWTPPLFDHHGGSSGTVLIAEGLGRYHVAGCLALAGLETKLVPADGVAADLTPCLLCMEPAPIVKGRTE
jgi:hypothetical protein